jgi:hypothetical protein
LELAGDVREFGDRENAHLPHDVTAVHFNRAFSRSKFAGNFLVHFTGHDPLEHFRFAFG